MERKRGGIARRKRIELSSLVLCLLFASSLQRTQAVANPQNAQVSMEAQIVATRLRIYNQVIQALAIETAKGVGQGVITTVPPLPFGQGKTTQEVVKLDVHTLQLNGFTFHEFYLPPGVRVSTTEPTIILSYQKFVLSNAPINPPEGFEVVSPVVRLTAFPISALSNAAAQPLVVLAPAGTPITVTFLIPVTQAFCATFNTSGQLTLVTTQSAPARTVCDATSIGTFTLTRVPAPPPGLAPAPGPSLSPSSSPSPSTEPPTVAPGPVEPPPSPITFPPGELSPPAESSPPVVLSPPSPGFVASPPSPAQGPEAANTASSSNTGLIVGLAVGLGIPLLILAAVGIWYASRAVARGRLEGMEKESDKRASLETAIVGGSRAPAAGALRTRPYLESEDLTSDRI